MEPASAIIKEELDTSGDSGAMSSTSSPDEASTQQCEKERKRKYQEAFEKAKETEEGIDGWHGFDEKSFQLARQKRKEYTRGLEWRLAQPRVPLHITQMMKEKDQIISVLKKTKEDVGPDTLELVTTIEELTNERNNLHTRLEEEQSVCKSLKQENRRLELKLDQQDLQMIEHGIFPGMPNPKDKVIEALEEDKKKLSEELSALEASSWATETSLRRKVNGLQEELVEAKLQNQADWDRYRKWRQETQASKEREINKMQAIVEEKSKLDATELANLKRDTTSLKKAHTSFKKIVESFPSSVEMMVHETNAKIKKAILDTEERCREMQIKYANEMKLRKQYYNQLIELRGNIRVFCRPRPLATGEASIVTPDPQDDSMMTVTSDKGETSFTFDKVFADSVSQEEVFSEVSSLIRSVLDGYNVCIFAYGQTGAGKTHTMEGTTQNPGVNPRALQLLYEATQSPAWSYQLEAGVLEIYKETICDLLNPDPHAAPLEVKLRSDGSGVHAAGQTWMAVDSLAKAKQVFEQGKKNRSVASTNMNQRSSRSHCLLTVNVAGTNKVTGATTQGRLHLVDLAGSERVCKTQAGGERLEEAKAINKSLSSLGDVISALKNKSQHIPFRNSKLTYLLKESLDGDSKTLMILQVSGAESNAGETTCTLNFGQRVRSAEMHSASGTPRHLRPATPSSAASLRDATPTRKQPASASKPSHHTPRGRRL